MHPMRRRRAAALLTLTLVALPACGDDDDGSSAPSQGTEPASSPIAAGDEAFPITIEHVYGETVIPALADHVTAKR